VAAAFAKGAVLLDGSSRNYMIHASRREKAGLGEVHTLDTDIIYVQEGSATFVTGGTLEDAKTIEPNEIRGASIQGGDTREITKGDVIVVPDNTPHWFKDVKAPFTYYVVKVR
jgi:glc operon protein GlcG